MFSAKYASICFKKGQLRAHLFQEKEMAQQNELVKKTDSN